MYAAAGTFWMRLRSQSSSKSGSYALINSRVKLQLPIPAASDRPRNFAIHYR
jgi:hypothetical protein